MTHKSQYHPFITTCCNLVVVCGRPRQALVVLIKSRFDGKLTRKNDIRWNIAEEAGKPTKSAQRPATLPESTGWFAPFLLSGSIKLKSHVDLVKPTQEAALAWAISSWSARTDAGMIGSAS